MVELVPLDQVLEDAHGVAAELDLGLDPGPMRFAGRGADRIRSRWPGWGIFRGAGPGAGGHPGGF